MKKILTALVLILVLSSCWAKEEIVKEKKHNLSALENIEMKNNIKKLDKEGQKLVIEYFSSKDEKKKLEIKEKINKHMLDIQWKIKDIKWETIEEKNKEIQKITKKIKLYKSLNF